MNMAVELVEEEAMEQMVLQHLMKQMKQMKHRS
jgi:hypothetical protein